jgi:membrane-associated protease RseP (regulator of RpoE activity)
MNPEFVKLMKIPPVMPLIPYLPEIFKVDWLPPFYFTYWIVAIALVAIFHEAAHGIFARFYNIKIKSTGFGFLGPFLAFFVEQDDKQMQKSKPFHQMTILAAGVFANILLTIIFFILIAGFFHTAYTPSGVLIRGYSGVAGDISLLDNALIRNETIIAQGINLTRIELENSSYFVVTELLNNKDNNANYIIKFYLDSPAIRKDMLGKTIIALDNNKITNPESLEIFLDSKNPGDKINISLRDNTNKSKPIETFSIVLAKYPNNMRDRALIWISGAGSASSNSIKAIFAKTLQIFKNPDIDYLPKVNPELTIFIYTMLWWILFINLSVAIVNMFPLPIFDGGRFFYLTILLATRKEKIAQKSLKYISKAILLAIIFITLLWAIGLFL